MCCRRGGRDMIARTGGNIANISSIGGITPVALAVYGTMKSAVNMLTRILAGEWARTGSERTD